MATKTAKRPELPPADTLEYKMQRLLVGQDHALDKILPYVSLYKSGLAPSGRPVGVFLLLGPTGTGKSHTIEALAQSLHGSEKSMLTINCGEFQLDHEVARLIGAPPGYLGHRETQPIITQRKLNESTSMNCALSLVLFDEIEKAAPSLSRLLLGVLDKGVLNLGDNTPVNFENSLIFMTSNLGAGEMAKEARGRMGLPVVCIDNGQKRMEAIGLAAMKKKFSPEFVNRIDCPICYHPLSRTSLECILDFQLEEFQIQIYNKLGAHAFKVEVPARTRNWLLEKGTSKEYGARELKRTIHKHVIQVVSSLVAAGDIQPQCVVRMTVRSDGSGLYVVPATKAGAA